MPTGPQGQRRPQSTTAAAVKVARIATGDIQEDTQGVLTQGGSRSEAARLMGIRGGRARADSLSPERRQEIARKAAITRWKKARSS